MNVNNTTQDKINWSFFWQTKLLYFFFQIQINSSCSLCLIQIKLYARKAKFLLSFRLLMKTVSDFAMTQNSSVLQKHVGCVHLCSTIQSLALRLLLFLHLTLQCIHLSLSPLSLIECILIQKTTQTKNIKLKNRFQIKYWVSHVDFFNSPSFSP